MTLLNHIGVLIIIILSITAIFFYCKLANYLVGSTLFKVNYLGFMKFILIVYPTFESFYWTFKIFF